LDGPILPFGRLEGEKLESLIVQGSRGQPWLGGTQVEASDVDEIGWGISKHVFGAGFHS